MEEIIQHEIRQLCNSLDKQLDHPLAMDHIFNISVVNALWTLISGSRFELNDPELLELIKKMDAVIKNVGGMRLLNMLPWLRHIAPQMSGWIDNQNRATALINFIGNVINKHIVDFKSNKEAVKEDPNDFIDAFLVQIDSSVAGSTFHGELGCQNLKAGLLDLLIAGSETTSTVLTWAILFMIKHPDIQTKVRNEILVEVGSSILVHLEDRLRLPYTEAVVQEILRLSCVAPLGVPHYAQADIHLGQYTIPKGSTIYPNLHRIVSNPEVFPEPRTFMPERYLNTKGQYVKNDNNIVFGVGE
jgi:cytochrome P450